MPGAHVRKQTTALVAADLFFISQFGMVPTQQRFFILAVGGIVQRLSGGNQRLGVGHFWQSYGLPRHWAVGVGPDIVLVDLSYGRTMG